MNTSKLTAFALTLVVLSPVICSAHFPWVAVDDEGHALLFFGEGLAERNYHLPESIAKAELVWHATQTDQKLELVSVEEDAFIGLRSKSAIKPSGVLATNVVYGDYHGMQLIYYAQHSLGKPQSWSKQPLKKQKLQAVLQMSEDGGVQCRILWEGKPLEGADVTLFCEDGHEEGKAKTDAKGLVAFNGDQVEAGLNAILVGRTIKEGEGEDAVAKEAHYMTATFQN